MPYNLKYMKLQRGQRPTTGVQPEEGTRGDRSMGAEQPWGLGNITHRDFIVIMEIYGVLPGYTVHMYIYIYMNTYTYIYICI